MGSQPTRQDQLVQDAERAVSGRSPRQVIGWVAERFGEAVAVTSSFQTQSLPLLHMVAEEAPQLPVLFLDTGFHFPETLAFRDRMASDLGLNLRVLVTRLGHEGFRHEYGDLHRQNPDLCCHLNKVQPLEHALEGYEGWIAGIRRDQTSARAHAPSVSMEKGVCKVCPIISWTDDDVQQYIARHDLPAHPLAEKGYQSIGCAPCTRAVRPEEEQARAGRWSEREKTECGLHFS